jgi:uncharacterized protein
MDLLLAKSSNREIALNPKMMNRHGIIAGATGTGKTVTLQAIAEHLSSIGVPVFLADIKGDLSGISQAGGGNPKIDGRLKELGIESHNFEGFPVTFWDVHGEKGHPVRATISDMGPLLLSRLLNLNDTQTGVLNLVFKIADDSGMLLLDMKDLRMMLQFVGDNDDQYKTEYGNISKATIGAIQRALLEIEQQGGDILFGEPALNVFDLIQIGAGGKGMVNILAAEKLMQSPKMYATFLLWLLSELFENLPEVGDLDKPKLVFIFDEAHLLFDEAPDILLDKIEQVVRLIRSKGIGVFFVTQNPIDIPDKVAAQLGNRVQHALRAFTPRDQKAVKAMAQTFRSNPDIEIESVITELAVGEALISLLDEKGSPTVVERAFIVPPHSKIGPISDAERAQVIKSSFFYGRYENMIDRESAYEILKKRAEQTAEIAAQAQEEKAARPRGRQPDTLMQTVAKTAVRTVGTAIAGQLVRGILGSLFGGRRR